LAQKGKKAMEKEKSRREGGDGGHGLDKPEQISREERD
jgi:hypothetical protein